jgi:hypothetical protein
MNTQFVYKNANMTFYDAKLDVTSGEYWLKDSKNKTIVLYCVNISYYDRCFHDPREKVIPDYIQSVLAEFTRWIQANKHQFILVFTHYDVFMNKIEHVPILNSFPEYIGSDDPDVALEFFVNMFSNANDDSNRAIPILVLDVMDSEVVQDTFDYIMDDLDSCLESRVINKMSKRNTIQWKIKKMILERGHLEDTFFGFR